jgi:predicted enzyme related to lactoylglutathione lyase
MGQVERYPNGTFCWVDLGTTDAPGAKAFYGGLFGWEFDDLPTGEKGTYSTCRLDGLAVAGLYDRAETPGWGSYISVDDVDRAAGQARELGAEVLVEPFDTPGGGRVALVRDAAGATVSLSQPGERFGAELVNQDSTWTWNELVSNDLAAGPGSTASCSGGRARTSRGRSGGRPSPSGTC